MPHFAGISMLPFHYEMAEYLQVTEEYLQEALECYSRKYGENLVTIDNYAIRFVPSLQVMEFWK